MAKPNHFREAITEVLQVEMRRDPRVILLGEDIVGGMGGTAGEEDGGRHVRRHRRSGRGVRPRARNRHADHRVGNRRRGQRRGADRPAPGGGSHVHGLPRRLPRPDPQPDGQVPLHVRRQGASTGRDPHADGCGLQRRRAAFAEPVRDAHVDPGHQGGVPSSPADAKGLLPAAIRDNDPVIFCEHKMLYGEKGEVPDGEYIIPFGQANITREGQAGHDRRVRAHGALANSRGQAGEGRHLRGGDRSAHDVAARRDAILESVAQDRSAGRRRRGAAALRRRRRHRGARAPTRASTS